MGAHNHTINDPGHTHTYTNTNTSFLVPFDIALLREIAEGNFPIQSTATGATGITINNTGGGQPHNIMNPTLFIGNLFVYTE